MGEIIRLKEDEALVSRDADEIFIDSLPADTTDPASVVSTTEGAKTEFISLRFDERSRPRRRCLTDAGTKVALALPRGTILTDGLTIHNSSILRIKVKAAIENVIVVSPSDKIQLCSVAHHLGNWHRSVQLNADGSLVVEPDEPLLRWLTQHQINFQHAQLAFHPNLKGAVHDTIISL